MKSNPHSLLEGAQSWYICLGRQACLLRREVWDGYIKIVPSGPPPRSDGLKGLLLQMRAIRAPCQGCRAGAAVQVPGAVSARLSL